MIAAARVATAFRLLTSVFRSTRTIRVERCPRQMPVQPTGMRRSRSWTLLVIWVNRPGRNGGRPGRLVWNTTARATAVATRSVWTASTNAQPIMSREHNFSIANLEAERFRDAVDLAQGAVEVDPANPVFLENLAIALHRADRSADAFLAYQRALNTDSTLSSSRNNYGVLLENCGDWIGAAHAFAATVSSRPDYATG